MANLGVFRDDFYNAIDVLTAQQGAAGPTTTGVLTAAMITGAKECSVLVGNGAAAGQTYTTDTAVNIIAALQTAVATAAKANVGGAASSLGAVPPLGVPNLFNVSWMISIMNQGTTAPSTLVGGTGVTLAAALNGGILNNSITLGAPLIPAMSRYIATVTGPASITLTRVM